ncbi:MAG: hypothetical protein RLZZ516_1507 [Cyanobacteriota bacterium]|jgi:antirestriction protein ArdC
MYSVHVVMAAISVSSCPGSPAAPEERLTASLITLLELGTAPWRREWDATEPGHHCNLLSGRRYSGANPVLLTLGMHLRGSTLPYWCGFAEAKAAGLFPRRGSRAVHVLRPQRQQASPHPEVESAQPAAGDPEPGVAPAAPRTWTRYRPVAVFNAADLDGPGLEALLARRRCAAGREQSPEPQRLAAAEAVLSAWPVPLQHGSACACYSPSLDRIALPERSVFHSGAAYYATWAHEAIHSTGHPSRLQRDLSGSHGSPAYAREELVAELGAVLLGDRLEIGSDTANHAAYLGGWIALLRESPRMLLQVLGDARRAADLICPERAIESPAASEAG